MLYNHAFISYSSDDKEVAVSICNVLEGQSVACWIAPRDIVPGKEYAAQITDGIDDCFCLILILSEKSDNSPHVRREIERAVSHKKAVIAYRTKNFEASKEMQYYLNSIHWLDAFDPLESKNLEKLSIACKAFLPKGIAETINEKPIQSFWNIPLPSNPFFTGRNDIIDMLHTSLHSSRRSVALFGLGGVGKTQVAVQYAYKFRNSYKAILWVEADSNETVSSNFASLTEVLELPLKESKQEQKLISLNRWFETNNDWLLIINNASDLHYISQFISNVRTGFVIFTTNSRSVNFIAEPIEVKEMTIEEGAFLLLRRANLISRNISQDKIEELIGYKEWKLARDISRELGGLPLALDQAGAYIEQTGCSLDNYLEIYLSNASELLSERGMIIGQDHPASVARTWSLSIERIMEKNPIALELLFLCAFLHPEGIPEEIFMEGCIVIEGSLKNISSNPGKLNLAVAEIAKYSLIGRNSSSRMLTIHRLIQVVIRENLVEEERKKWALNSVKALEKTFPDVSVSTYAKCERLLPCIQICTEWIKKYNFEFEEAANLLNQAGYYLFKKGDYNSAVPLCKYALIIRKKVLGDENYKVAITLNDLARIYKAQGLYSEAKELYDNALKIREKCYGKENHEVATTLNDLGSLYFAEGNIIMAQILFENSLLIREKILGTEHRDVAASLNNLGNLYRVQKDYDKAKSILERALTIRLNLSQNQDHPRIAVNLHNLALVYSAKKEYDEALKLCKQSLKIREKVFGKNHPDVAFSQYTLGKIFKAQLKYEQAKPLFESALTIVKKVFDPNYPGIEKRIEKINEKINEINKYNSIK